MDKKIISIKIDPKEDTNNLKYEKEEIFEKYIHNGINKHEKYILSRAYITYIKNINRR